VKRAEQFSRDLLDVVDWVGEEHKPSGTIKTDFVSGEMATDKRRIKLSQLKALAPLERRLLANARCLSEGVDVPSLDGVAFIDPRRSQIDIIQAVGRAIRLSANKTAGIIVLPVFIEDGVDPAAAIESSNFKPIWDVLNALKAHDDIFSAELDSSRTAMGRTGVSAVDPVAFAKIRIDLPQSAGHGFVDSLRTKMVEQVTAQWNVWYGILQTYAEVHGNCHVPATYALSDGYRLGSWVATQRQFREQMPTERQARLEALPGWAWDKHEESWEFGFLRLSEYAAAHGNCKVPIKYVRPDGFRLGRWVGIQRQGREEMPPERQARLEKLSGWSWRLVREKLSVGEGSRWEFAFLRLSEYAAESGNCKVPSGYELPNGFRLGGWVHYQRNFREKIPPERQARLEALSGWFWNDPEKKKWELGFLRLSEYAAEHGNCKVPSAYELPDGFRLGRWVRYQRQIRESMPPERLAQLEALPGWSW
jgi:hypothetical protein